jgi:hypothetical protein
MTQIILNDEQTRLLAGATVPVVIVDSRGRKVAEIPAPLNSQEMSEEEWIAEAIRRRERYEQEGGPSYTTREVLEYLRSLKPE